MIMWPMRRCFKVNRLASNFLRLNDSFSLHRKKISMNHYRASFLEEHHIFSSNSRYRKNFSNDFKNSSCAFLSYGVNDPGKVEVITSNVNMNEAEVCSEKLKSDFTVIDQYLRFLEGHGRDVSLTKENTLYYIFDHFDGSDFAERKYYKNIRKLLNWNCENDFEMEKKIEGIKKTIINKYALESIFTCVSNYSTGYSSYRKKWVSAMNNVLKFLFEGKLEDEEWQTMLFDLKMKVIEKLNGNDDLWDGKFYYDGMEMLIDWGKENENIRKGNGEIRKCFIECLKNNINAKAIPTLIYDCNFFRSFFEGDENMADFEKNLWNFKEFLVKKVISDIDHKLTCQLLENVEVFSDFLKWKDFDKSGIQDLKVQIFDVKGVYCCLSWIENEKLRTVSDFFNWCMAENSNHDWKLKIEGLKNDVLYFVVCQNPELWGEEFFKRVDQFLLLLYYVDKKDLEFYKTVDECAINSCCALLKNQAILNNNYSKLLSFIKWAEFEGEESIENLKKNILIEFLNVKYSFVWEDRYMTMYSWDRPDKSLDKFLYCYGEPDPVKIANMKLDVLEIHFFPACRKLFREEQLSSFKGFLEWSFDDHMKSGKCLPRTRKFIREIFEKFGKEFCVTMFTKAVRDFCFVGCAVKVRDFWNLCFDPKIGIQIPEAELWAFKKDCINQLLYNEIEKTVKDEYYWNNWLDYKWNDIVNTFLPLGSKSSDLNNKISEYKDFIAQKYGVAYMELCFKCLLKEELLYIPQKFLKWLFEKEKSGDKKEGKEQNKKDKIYLDEEKLLDFKKQVLKTLINIKHQDLLEKDCFYDALDKFCKFELSPANSNVIDDLKRSVCKVQGVELCINLMRQNNEDTLEGFLEWVKDLFGNNFNDFKHAVELQCSGDLMQKFDAYFRNN